MRSKYFQQGQSARPLAEINMVPLIDVMLVLLVIFMIAAPLLTHSVKVNLPVAGHSSTQNQPDDRPLTITIKTDGTLHLGDEALPRASLQQQLTAQARQNNQREIHIRADRDTPYHFVAETLTDAADAGLTRIGFIGQRLNSQR